MASNPDAMQAAMQGLERIFPDCALVLLVAPNSGPRGARVNYIGNGKREDILVLLKEMVARFEGRRPEGPETPQ